MEEAAEGRGPRAGLGAGLEVLTASSWKRHRTTIGADLLSVFLGKPSMPRQDR